MTKSKIMELLRDTEVEWRTLDDITDISTGGDAKGNFLKGQKEPTLERPYPIFANGIDTYGYTDVYRIDKEAVSISSIGNVGFVAFREPFFTPIIRLKVFTVKDKDTLDIKFLYHFLSTQNFTGTNASLSSMKAADFKKIEIPIPPLKTQEKIVKILDKFTDYVTELTAELTAELMLHQKQYSYFREQLLSENYLNSLKSETDNVLTLTTLGEVTKIKNGKDWKKLGSGEIPVYGSGGIMTYVDTFSYDKPSVLIPRKGSIENIFYVDKPFWNVDTIFHTEIFEDKILPKYLYYFMQQFDLKTLSTDSTRPSLTQTVLNKIELPLPSISIQSKVVQILDKFQDFIGDVTGLLPEEIEQRRKQYEYYREKLLTFDDNMVSQPLIASHFFELLAEVAEIFGFSADDSKVEWNTLGELLVRTKGTKITAGKMKELHKEKAPVKIFAGGKTFAAVDYSDIPEKDINYHTSIIVKSRGVIGFEYYDKPFSHKNEMWAYHNGSEKLNLKYVYYVLKTKETYFQQLASKMQMPQISIPDTDNFKIPLPSLEEQNRIVKILDKFDTLTNDITQGLPKEIELRTKQYEYFREKLLSFD